MPSPSSSPSSSPSPSPNPSPNLTPHPVPFRSPRLGSTVLYCYPGADKHDPPSLFAALVSRIDSKFEETVDLHVLNPGSQMPGGPVVVVRGVMYDPQVAGTPVPGRWFWPVG